jgi:Coenzyme PQQ synthesis protein D (PqqD)
MVESFIVQKMLESIYIQGEGLLTRNIAGETLIVPVRGRVGDLDSLFTLNEVGMRVWSLLDGRCNIQQIVQTISSEYDVNEATAAADVNELLDTMAEVGLVRAV